MIVEQRRRSGELHQVRADGGGSPRYLNTFSNLFNVAEHNMHINTCYVLLLSLTVPMSPCCPLKIIRIYHILLNC